MDEPDGFGDFVRAHERSLLRTGWLLMGDWPKAEDLVQSALAATWPRWSAIASSDPARLAYVRRVIATTAIRSGQRRWRGELPVERLPEAPADREQDIDLRRDLVAALGTLPLGQRAALVLRYFVDLSEAETAATLGCSVGTVKSQCHKAIARLRAVPGLAEIWTGDAS